MTVHLTGNRILSVRTSCHRHLYDKTRQTLEAPYTRHIRYLRRSKDLSLGVQAAIRFFIQVKAGIWDRRRRRALRQKVALPTALNKSRTLYQRTCIDRVASPVWHRVDH